MTEKYWLRQQQASLGRALCPQAQSEAQCIAEQFPPMNGDNHTTSGVDPKAAALEAKAAKHADEHERPKGEHEHVLEWTDLVRIGFVALAALAVWFRIWEPFPHISVIGVAATPIGGYPIFKEAFENIVERKMTMELSMTIALLAALAIGEFFTALVIAGFVLVAEVLEGLTVGRGRRYVVVYEGLRGFKINPWNAIGCGIEKTHPNASQ